jgi:hypothetical protein
MAAQLALWYVFVTDAYVRAIGAVYGARASQIRYSFKEAAKPELECVVCKICYSFTEAADALTSRFWAIGSRSEFWANATSR